MKIEIVSGSMRKESITFRVALHLQQVLQAKSAQYEVGIIDLRAHPMPFVESVFSSPEKAPEAIQPAAKRMFDADAYILLSPEYNGTFSPALSNWFSHYPKRLHKAVGIVTASNGALGGIRAAMQLQNFSLALFAVPSPQMMVIGQVDKKFAPDGTLIEESYKNNIDNFAAEFLWLVEKLKS